MKTHFCSRHPLAMCFMLFFIATSCDFSASYFLDNQSSHNEDEIMRQEIILKQARRSLYENDLDRSDSLLHRVDSLNLPKGTLGFYYLTKGFLTYKKGDVTNAINSIERAAGIFDEYGNEESKAEENLIWGLIYEEINLPSQAAESFYTAMEYYKTRPQEPEYFYLVLGLARTSPDNDTFIMKAEESLKMHSSSRNSLLYYKAKAYINEDKNEKYKLYLNAYNSYRSIDDFRGEINMLASLALSCQLMGKNDSSNFYLTKANGLVAKESIPKSRLVHYYLIKAYVDTRSGRLLEAESTIDSTLIYAKDQPALLSQVYLRIADIESVLQNYSKAYSGLKEHIELESDLLKLNQNTQTAIMSIGYKLNQRQLELTEIKNFWLRVVIGLLLAMMTMGIVFIFVKRKDLKEKQAIKELVSFSFSENEGLQKNIEKLGKLLNVELQTNFNELDKNLLRNNVTKREQIMLWNEFHSNFQIRYPRFYEKLQKLYPELSSNDLKYCACVFSNFNNHQIGILLDVTIDAVKKAKRRLREAFKIKPEADLFSHLSNSIQSDPKIDNNN